VDKAGLVKDFKTVNDLETNLDSGLAREFLLGRLKQLLLQVLAVL
jgi:hypothetical protein